MWTSAGRLRLSTVLAARRWLVVCVCALSLAACARAGAPEQALATRCLPLSGNQGQSVSIVPTERGTLSIRIEERAVSVVATIDDDRSGAGVSPVERFGSIALTSETARDEVHTVRIRTEDSKDITGEVCIRAEVYADSAAARIAAERSFAAAGRATGRHDWQTAFDEYRNAANSFDHLHLARSSAAARHAMAELAYLRLDRKRDSFALAAEALADYDWPGTSGRHRDVADQIKVGLLTELEGKALLDTPGRDAAAVMPVVRRLLTAARKYDLASRIGARQLPRLDIMTGFLEYGDDRPGRAHDLFAQAAQSCEALRDWDCYAIANQNLALLAAESSNYATALADYAAALQRLPPDLNPKLTADIRTNFGHLQGVVGLFSGSEHSHATAMHEYARLGDCPGVRRSLSYSGNLMLQIGTLSDAEDLLERAASSNCPDLLASRTDSTSARSDSRGTACTQPLESTDLGTNNKMIVFNSLLSLGDAFMMEGEPHVAQRCINAAQLYAVTARSRMRLANARGNALLENNDAQGARGAFELSLHIADEARIPAMYEYRGTAQLGLVRAMLLAGDPRQAVGDGFPALRASVGRGDIDQTVTSLRLLASGLRGSQQQAEAAHTLQAAVDLIKAVPIDELDGEKRATYLATQYTVFADLTDLYASQTATDLAMAGSAFTTSEEGRARSLRYALTQATRAASASLEAAPASRYQQFLHEIVNLADPQPGGSRANLVDELDAAARREIGTEQSFDRSQLTHTLEQLGATLVEYAVGEHDMFAFVVNDDTTHVVRLGDKRAIAAASAELHDRLRDPETPPTEVKAIATRLAKLVFWPLGGTEFRRRIIFVPDDALHTIPFNILPWSANPTQQLILNHAEVSIVPSASFLTNLRLANRVHTTAPRIELIGDPVFRISDWHHECVDTGAKPVLTQAVRAFDWTEALPRLPGSREEVQAIAQLARQSRPTSRVETFLGCAAVPGALRQAAANHVDLLHIATHARVDAQRPRLSALALTPEPGSHSGVAAFGLLDILALKLSSSLVVLSACDTSRGRLLPGEGVLGPAQAFLQAGAESVLASYWRVDDQATSGFMQRFYHYLLVEHQPAGAALRNAQLDAAAAAPSFDWAAFALYGLPDATL
jgi:CHAT domain-containing protein